MPHLSPTFEALDTAEEARLEEGSDICWRSTDEDDAVSTTGTGSVSALRFPCWIFCMASLCGIDRDSFRTTTTYYNEIIKRRVLD